MQQNRDFIFHGKVEAGLTLATNCKFSYDDLTLILTLLIQLSYMLRACYEFYGESPVDRKLYRRYI